MVRVCEWPGGLKASEQSWEGRLSLVLREPVCWSWEVFLVEVGGGSVVQGGMAGREIALQSKAKRLL